VKRIEDILAQCIEDVKVGKYSLEDCLERYPAMRKELEPLLRIALNIQEPPDVRPSEAFKIRARVNLMEHIHASQAGKETTRSATKPGVRLSWHTGWLRAATIIVTVIIAISALGTGTAYASQGSIPGDILYPVKLGTEQIQRVLTADGVKEVELELRFANKRLEEMESVIYKRPGEISVAVTGYERNLNLAIIEVEQIKNYEISARMLEMIAFDVSNHLYILEELEDSASEEVRGSIGNAIDIAINGHIKALRIMAREDPVRATEINLEAMQRRLNRAKVESDRGNTKQVERALQQFEKLRRFGEEMSEPSKAPGYDTREIDELNARATTGHLETMGNIYEKVPEETKGVVEEAIDTSVEEYEEAVKGLQQQGATDDLPETPPLPDELPDDVQKRILQPESKGPGNGGK